MGKPKASKGFSRSDYWRRKVGQFIETTLTRRGDAHADIAPCLTGHVLRKEETWEKIQQGDRQLPIGLFVEALREVCRLYALDDTNLSRPASKGQRLVNEFAQFE